MNRVLRVLLVSTAVLACTVKTDPADTDGASTANDSSGSTAATTAPTTTATDSGETASSTGEPWTVDECLTRFEWSCETPERCDPPMPVPFNLCDEAKLCDPLTIKTDGSLSDYTVVDSEATALCVLEALRDRKPGSVTIIWGDPQGFGGDTAVAITANVTIVDDGTVLMNWTWQVNTCCFQSVAVSRRVQLQPASFFTDCLAAPTTASLIACFTAGSTAENPAPAGWLPPWTLGTCDETLPPGCPGA